MTDVLQIFPPVVWGAVIGALLTLFGVNMQLRYNSRERERDRQMQLRRDVYLEAAEGLSNSTDFLFRFTKADIPLAQLGEGGVKATWLNKVYTVASLETIVAFAEAGAALAASAFDLFRLRIRVEEVADAITIEKQKIENMQKYQEQMKSMAAATANEPPSEALLKRLEWVQAQIDETWPLLREATDNLETLVAEHAKRLRAIVEQAVNYSIAYHKKLRRALVSIRTELELPLDHDETSSRSR